MTFHNWTASPPVCIASVRPSGENGTERMAPRPGANGAPSSTGRPGSATFHRRTVSSLATVARTRPSGRNAPIRPIMSAVGIDQSRTLLSPLPVASVRPSGLKPTA